MYLLDTNTVIDFCNSKLPLNAKNFLIGIEPIISVISNIEMFASSKIPEHEVKKLQEFIEMATIYDKIDFEIVAKSIEIRQKYKIKLPDAIIAATAIVNHLTLITRNISDFNDIEGLEIINPYNL
jgi:predicted nucleic acid-binding protein